MSVDVRREGRVALITVNRPEALNALSSAILEELHEELRGYPVPMAVRGRKPTAAAPFTDVVVPVQFTTEAGTLSFFSTTTVFGTPVDITLSELAIESFFPADAATAELLRKLA